MIERDERIFDVNEMCDFAIDQDNCRQAMLKII